MNLDLKINKKDAVLLGLLAFVLLLYLGVWWLLRPANEEVEANTRILEDKEMQVMLMSDRIAQQPVLDAKLQEAEALLAENTTDFRPLLTNNQLDDLVTGMLLSHNLTAKRLEIKGAELKQIEPYYASALALLETELKKAAEAQPAEGQPAAEGTEAEGTAEAQGAEVGPGQGILETKAEEDPLMAGLLAALDNNEFAKKAMLKELPQSVFTAEIVECQAVGTREDVQRFVDSFSEEPAIRPIRFEIRSVDSLMQQLSGDVLTGAQEASANAEIIISLAVYMFDGVQEAPPEDTEAA